MGTREGRTFVYAWLQRCNLYGGSYTGEALSSAYAEGRRSVAIELSLELQRAAPSEYSLMVGEKVAAVATAELRRQADESPDETDDAE